jgi:hypothetical protein
LNPYHSLFICGASFCFLSHFSLLLSVFCGVSICGSRCKLLRFAADSKEWKERGLGDVRLLKTKSGLIRVVMRQEKTNKLVLNHFGVLRFHSLLPLASFFILVSCFLIGFVLTFNQFNHRSS